jgi:hypothetical protein
MQVLRLARQRHCGRKAGFRCLVGLRHRRDVGPGPAPPAGGRVRARRRPYPGAFLPAYLAGACNSAGSLLRETCSRHIWRRAVGSLRRRPGGAATPVSGCRSHVRCPSHRSTPGTRRPASAGAASRRKRTAARRPRWCRHRSWRPLCVVPAAGVPPSRRSSLSIRRHPHRGQLHRRWRLRPRSHRCDRPPYRGRNVHADARCARPGREPPFDGLIVQSENRHQPAAAPTLGWSASWVIFLCRHAANLRSNA